MALARHCPCRGRPAALTHPAAFLRISVYNWRAAQLIARHEGLSVTGDGS